MVDFSINGEKLDLTDLENTNEIFVADWGKTVIVAPHPDDESLGCGGAIALLRELQNEVCVLVLTDGTLSHPNSKRFPPDKLRDLREKEIIDALKIFDVAPEKVVFFRYRDRSFPNKKSPHRAAAIERCRDFLSAEQPQTVLVPWRRDPHPDHRAAFSLIEKSKTVLRNVRILEYPIWLWEIAETGDAPFVGEVAARKLYVGSVIEKKRRAIFQHRSQITDLIDDDPNGFRLSAEILQRFLTDWEIYLESV